MKFAQKNPAYARGQRDRGWTTITGWWWNAKRIRTALVRNMSAVGGYKCGFLLYAPKDIDLATFKADKSKIITRLRRKGVTAHIQWEISTTNRLHAHGVSLTPRRTLKGIWSDIEKLFPGWKLRISNIRNWPGYCAYVVKAKISSEHSKDVYAKKRCIPLAKLGFDKHQTIGNFWAKPIAAYWQDVKDTEAKISGWEQLPGYARLMDELHDLTGYARRKMRYMVDPTAPAHAARIEALLTIDAFQAETDNVRHNYVHERTRPAQHTGVHQRNGLDEDREPRRVPTCQATSRRRAGLVRPNRRPTSLGIVVRSDLSQFSECIDELCGSVGQGERLVQQLSIVGTGRTRRVLCQPEYRPEGSVRASEADSG